MENLLKESSDESSEDSEVGEEEEEGLEPRDVL